MVSATFSASIIVGALRLPLVIEGIMEASTTRRPSMPSLGTHVVATAAEVAALSARC